MSPTVRAIALLLAALLAVPAPLAAARELDAGPVVDAVDEVVAPVLDDAALAARTRAAPEWSTPGRLVVGLEGDAGAAAPALEAIVAPFAGRVTRVDATLAFAVVEVPAAQQDAALKALDASPLVRYAHEDGMFRATFTPDDPRLTYQWGPAAMGMEGAWDVSTGTHDITVAVLDTGIDAAHEDLVDNLCVVGPDFDDGDGLSVDEHGHGTHVAGTVAGTLDNGIGVAGMADACIMAVKVLSPYGSGDWSNLASALVWAADNGANIISMSLGGCPGCDPGAPVSDAISYAASQGVLIVAAAGNAGCAPVSYPAAYAEVVAVAALAPPGDVRAGFSSCGDDVELSAPGEDVHSTALTAGYLSDPSGYMNLSGTSMATPHVAGVAALVWGELPALSAGELRCLLAQTSDDILAPGRDAESGFGRVDPAAAIAQGECVPQPPGAFSLSAHSGDAVVRVRWSQPAVLGPEVTHFNLYRGLAPDALSFYASVPAPASGVDDTAVLNGVTYYYAASAVNDVGEGPLSPVDDATPMAPVTIPYTVDFESGDSGWNTDGLWHVTTDRSNSSVSSMYYGMENGEGLEDNTYDTGSTTAGSLVSPAIDLTGASVASLRFWQRWEGEGGGWERPIVLVSTQGSEGPWTAVYDNDATSGEGSFAVDLTPFVGQVVTLRFLWDTRDPVLNEYEGWYVDDIAVLEEATPIQCDDASDAYGHTCAQIDYAFDDISLTGTPLSLGDDGLSDAIALPFALDFYGRTYTELRVSANGWITLEENATNSACCSGRPFPDPLAPHATIGGFWTDLAPHLGGSVQVGQAGSAFVVQFTDVPTLEGQDVLVTFQVKVFPTGVIETHYDHVDTAFLPASAGIEDCASQDGLQVRYGEFSLNDVAVRYTPPLLPGDACDPADINQPPSITILTPVEGEVVSGTMVVSGNTSDPDGQEDVQSTWVYFANQAYYVGTQANWSVAIDTTTVADGPRYVEAVACDAAYCAGAAVGITVANGNATTTVQITSPADNTFVAGDFEVTGTYGMATSLTLLVDGSWVPTVGWVTNDTFGFQTSTAGYPEGWHWVCVEASDGNATALDCVDLYYMAPPNAPPQVSISYPWEGATVSGPFWAYGSATDPNGDWTLSEIKVFVDDVAIMVGPANTSWGVYVDTTNLTFGAHTLSVYVNDVELAAGNASATFLLDDPSDPDAPELAVYYPWHGAHVSGYLHAYGYAQDVDGDLASVELRIDGGAWLPTLGNGSWSRYIDTAALGDGVHDLEVRATDATGLTDSVTLQFIVDNAQRVAPALVIDAPEADSVVAGEFEVRGRAFDPDSGLASVQVRFGYGDWETAFGLEAWSRGFSAVGYPTGIYLVEARAVDTEGNEEYASVYVWVDAQADLVIPAFTEERIQLQTDAGDAPHPMAIHRLSVTVRNEGNWWSDWTTLRVEAITSTGGDGSVPELFATQTVCEVMVGSLEPGAEQTLTCDWDPLGWAGDVTLVATVDGEDFVPESDDWNNAAALETFVLVGGTGRGVGQALV